MTNKSEQDINDEIAQRVREIELLERVARDQGMAFSALNEEQVARKVRVQSTGTPYIYAQAWISGTSPGSSAFYSVYVSNPDPVSYYPVFFSIYFGVANYLDSQPFGQAAAHGNFNGDTRWPYMTSRPFGLASGATHNETFNYTTPAGVPLTTYPGNSVLWNGSHHDQGSYFDRGLFYVTLS
jgi:hypothetical protein